MTEWGDLDYLIVDLPPGTSDGPLTVLQTLNLDGFVIVTAPQDISKLDAIRSINMIKKLNQKVLGIIENFSGTIFGSGAGREISEKFYLQIDCIILILSDSLDAFGFIFLPLILYL